jgi:hypothetical protein
MVEKDEDNMRLQKKEQEKKNAAYDAVPDSDKFDAI